MKHLKELALAATLALVFAISAFAGETSTPPCSPPEPGETSTPPCVVSFSDLDDPTPSEAQSVTDQDFVGDALVFAIESMLTVF